MHRITAIAVALFASPALLMAQIPALERDALLALYSSTNGPGWLNSTAWESAVVDTECSWFGVSCFDGHVIQLTLNDNQLSGTIPAQIGDLSNLRRLRLYSNQLVGTIPRELGNLASLEQLYLFSNHLTGSIPPEIGNLTSLQSLFLSANHLSGSIPPELAGLSSLESLFLSSNRLSGAIPSEIGSLVGLQGLTLYSNMLQGEVPASLVNLVNLTNTILSRNSLRSSDPVVQSFLADKDPDWDQTQTVAPTGITVDGVTTTTVTLTWNPIAYVGGQGRYWVSVDGNHPDVVFLDGFESADVSGWDIAASGLPVAFTQDKSEATVTLEGLEPGVTYDLVVFTVTDPYEFNQNRVVSEASDVIAVSTDS